MRRKDQRPIRDALVPVGVVHEIMPDDDALLCSPLSMGIWAEGVMIFIYWHAFGISDAIALTVCAATASIHTYPSCLTDEIEIRALLSSCSSFTSLHTAADYTIHQIGCSIILQVLESFHLN